MKNDEKQIQNIEKSMIIMTNVQKHIFMHRCLPIVLDFNIYIYIYVCVCASNYRPCHCMSHVSAGSHRFFLALSLVFLSLMVLIPSHKNGFLPQAALHSGQSTKSTRTNGLFTHTYIYIYMYVCACVRN